MEAVEFLKEKKRMCKGYKYSCCECPLWKCVEHNTIGCSVVLEDYPEKAVETVERWAKEHPLKTYALDFFEKFPNALKCVNGLPHSCKRNIYGGECSHNCTDCWNSPMEK